jgi:hypothetical protein
MSQASYAGLEVLMASKAQLAANALVNSRDSARSVADRATDRIQEIVSQQLQAFTTSEKDQFVTELLAHGNVHRACVACGVSRRTALTARDNDALFANAWAEALQSHIDAVEQSVLEQARDNTQKAQILAIFYLKSNKREVYGEQVHHDVAVHHDVVVELFRRAGSQLAGPKYDDIPVMDAELCEDSA